VLPKPLAVGILTLVTLVWSVDFGAQFVTDHQPSVAIQGTFLTLVGGALIRAGWVARRQVDDEAQPTEDAPPEAAGDQTESPAGRLAAPPTIPPPPPHNPYRTWDGRGRHGPLLRLLRRGWA
jgi:hypothetical protein